MIRETIAGLSGKQLKEIVQGIGEPAYRVKQIRNQLFHKLVASYYEMTDLPLLFRNKLVKLVRLHSLTLAGELYGKDNTRKYLFRLADGKTIESALMSYTRSHGSKEYTACISTQVGCPVGCSFCATGQQGFERNLLTSEILDQVLYLARSLKKNAAQEDNEKAMTGKINNIVFMGMGEPLANFGALWRAIEILNSQDGFGLGARNMTISTSGIVPQIERLSHKKLQIGLAVSLHAGDNHLRNKLVPINRKYPLEQLIPACQRYTELTGRRLSFEYVLFNGINDTPGQAKLVAGLIKGMNCHVNLIPANDTGDPSFRPPSRISIEAFITELKRNHINVSLRQRRGQDIDAGCGQLRSRLK